jgi:hypothetical protein
VESKERIFASAHPGLLHVHPIPTRSGKTVRNLLRLPVSKSAEKDFPLLVGGVQTPRYRTCGESPTRLYSACLLGALLLLFCVNARLSRYAIGARNLKLATTQRYLDSDETRLAASIAALLLLWCVAVVGVVRSAAVCECLQAAAACVPLRPGQFDPESHLRPPPLP